MDTRPGDQPCFEHGRGGMAPEACESAAGRGATGTSALATLPHHQGLPRQTATRGGRVTAGGRVMTPAARTPIHSSSPRTRRQRSSSKAVSRVSLASIRPTAAFAQGIRFRSSIPRLLPDVSGLRSAASAGASVPGGGAMARARPEGLLGNDSQAFSFVWAQPVQQLVQRSSSFNCFREAPLQTSLPLLGRVDAPSVVPPSLIKSVPSFRAAVRLCWGLRRARGLKLSDLGRDFGFTRQHVSDYLNEDDLPTRRSLPAERIADFEDLCGNTAISQWLAQRAKFTVLEELQAERAAA